MAAEETALNVLYGTMPVLWTAPGGSWEKDREVFLRVYRSVCRLQEAIADQGMLSHEFASADRAVQKTRFADGTVVVVNFGETPRRVFVRGWPHTLPQNGFVARGPRVWQSREVVRGKVRTRIEAPGYRFTEAEGGD